MIRLINCNSNDMRSYYNDTTLILINEDGSKEAVTVDGVADRSHLIVVPHGKRSMTVSRDRLRVHYFEPFYTDDGELLGTSVARNYKRAPWFSHGHLDSVNSVLNSSYKSTFNGVRGRIGTQFYVTPWNGTNLVMYLGELVGVYHDNIFWIHDSCIRERLKEIIYKEGLNYDVVPAPAWS